MKRLSLEKLFEPIKGLKGFKYENNKFWDKKFENQKIRIWKF